MIPVAPGAEDNASGVAVLLELARLAAREHPDLPVQFIAFGAEEPRGTGDALHHFDSQQLVADLSGAERRAISAMVALDRVGVRASYVPVARGNSGGTQLRNTLRAAGRQAGIATRAGENTTSDHWSYAKADIPPPASAASPTPATTPAPTPLRSSTAASSTASAACCGPGSPPSDRAPTLPEPVEGLGKVTVEPERV